MVGIFVHKQTWLIGIKSVNYISYQNILFLTVLLKFLIGQDWLIHFSEKVLVKDVEVGGGDGDDDGDDDDEGVRRECS